MSKDTFLLTLKSKSHLVSLLIFSLIKPKQETKRMECIRKFEVEESRGRQYWGGGIAGSHGATYYSLFSQFYGDYR
jgi:hypothetical protein